MLLSSTSTNQDRVAALAAVQTGAQFDVAHGHPLYVTRSVLVEDADKRRRATGDTVVCAIDNQVADIHIGRALDQDDSGNRCTGTRAGRVCRNACRLNHGAIVAAQSDCLCDFHLLRVRAFADSNGCSGRSGIHGRLDRCKIRVWACRRLGSDDGHHVSRLRTTRSQRGLPQQKNRRNKGESTKSHILSPAKGLGSEGLAQGI
jgi:hypothetical protein